jgi:hypothetical protein
MQAGHTSSRLKRGPGHGSAPDERLSDSRSVSSDVVWCVEKRSRIANGRDQRAPPIGRAGSEQANHRSAAAPLCASARPRNGTPRDLRSTWYSSNGLAGHLRERNALAGERAGLSTCWNSGKRIADLAWSLAMLKPTSVNRDGSVFLRGSTGRARGV